VHNVLKATELCCVFLTFQVSIMLKMSNLSASAIGGAVSEGGPSDNFYDSVLVVSLFCFVGLFFVSTLRALYDTYKISKQFDLTQDLDDSSTGQDFTEQMREATENFSKYAENKPTKEQQDKHDKLVQKNYEEKERLAQVRRKKTANKRNAVAKERQAEREAKSGRDLNSQDIELTETNDDDDSASAFTKQHSV